MIMGLSVALFCIAAVFSPLAAVSAFLIFYQEYKHHYIDKKGIFKKSFMSSMFVLVFFLAIGIFLAIILPLCFKS
jgi:hypothetical protein